MNKQELQKLLNKLGISVDVEGNLLTNGIVPRTDTLTNLLAVADAGNGEVAAATDTEAIVLYQGSPSVGIPFFRSGMLAIYNGTPGPVNFSAPTGDTVIPLHVFACSPPSWINETTDSFDEPSWNPFNADNALYLEGTVQMVGIGFTASTEAAIKLQYKDSGGAWLDLSGVAYFDNAAVNGNGTLGGDVRMFFRATSASLSSITALRLVLNISGAATGTVLASASSINLKAWLGADT